MISNKKQELVFEKDKTCLRDGISHGPLVTDNVRGEILCAKCGTILEDRVEDSGSEQKLFTAEDYGNSTRTGLGSALSIHDKGLSTVIGNTDRDASGNSISTYMKYTFNRLRTWDTRSKSSSAERNLRSAFVVMGAIQPKLEVSDAVVERAAYLYRKALTKNIIRGRTISGMILSALYIACRESGVPRTLQDVSSAGNVSFKNLSRHYRIFVKTLDLQVDSLNPSEFVSKIGTSVGLSEKAQRDALGIIEDAKKRGLADGKNPVSLAATALFLSGMINGEKATQDSIAKASGISSVTIRNVAKVFRKKMELGT
ncbi:transcription initiation factor IIB [Candidatus Nitrosotalea okcheonensis]|uniref:Transcription initiation factor IIB 2 n=1 Tax=Candidatus Nitrosotalea okcheonensis TaxID=1903276 RepID=A0A2H1FCX3_9ARCH|nr:transcription initiation factor IIB [Candidatus Nitrosotalea okcheonensis]MDE1728128.1 transcription initiation factor IIB [Nitrososphaerota archaeon]MDE1877091.1 transcription initiation factor IIB [Nitrososphaerota archaeon]SMH70597.1 Transcription initiation factor IIB 2 [Candidatus Nitrosotalea okcheonensis]